MYRQKDSLLFIVGSAGGTNYGYSVKSIIEKDDSLVVNISVYSPRVSGDMLSQYHIVIEIDKTYAKKDVKISIEQRESEL